jgi:hypothetical protein
MMVVEHVRGKFSRQPGEVTVTLNEKLGFDLNLKDECLTVVAPG